MSCALKIHSIHIMLYISWHARIISCKIAQGCAIGTAGLTAFWFHTHGWVQCRCAHAETAEHARAAHVILTKMTRISCITLVARPYSDIRRSWPMVVGYWWQRAVTETARCLTITAVQPLHRRPILIILMGIRGSLLSISGKGHGTGTHEEKHPQGAFTHKLFDDKLTLEHTLLIWTAMY